MLKPLLLAFAILVAPPAHSVGGVTLTGNIASRLSISGSPNYSLANPQAGSSITYGGDSPGAVSGTNSDVSTNTTYELTIDASSGTNIKFYIGVSGAVPSLVATISTNLPPTTDVHGYGVGIQALANTTSTLIAGPGYGEKF